MAAWPDDLLFEILLRLPVKAIHRFKCAAKPWCFLFEKPIFISQHLGISKKKNKRPLLYYNDEDHNLVLRLFDDQSLVSSQDLFDDQTLISCQDLFPPRFRRFCNVYDGLVCLYDDCKSNIALWNPATKKLRVLPPCEVKNMRGELSGNSSYVGFGGDSLSNDYKVIFYQTYIKETPDLVSEKKEGTPFYPCDQYSFAVYSMSSDSWRVLKEEEFDFCNPCLYSNSGMSVDGVHYCVSRSKPKLIAFHMGNEVVQLIDFPVGCRTSPRLFVLPDDRISLWAPHCDSANDSYEVFVSGQDCYKVWVLEDDSRSWTNLLTIGPLIGVQGMYGFFNQKQLVVRSGVEASEDEDSGDDDKGIKDLYECADVLLYDEETQELEPLKIKVRWFDLYIYLHVESLLLSSG